MNKATKKSIPYGDGETFKRSGRIICSCNLIGWEGTVARRIPEHHIRLELSFAFVSVSIDKSKITMHDENASTTADILFGSDTSVFGTITTDVFLMVPCLPGTKEAQVVQCITLNAAEHKKESYCAMIFFIFFCLVICYSSSNIIV